MWVDRTLQKTRLLAQYMMIVPKRWELKAAYNQGRLRNAQGTIEPADLCLVETGQVLRRNILEQCVSKYKNSGYRILFQMPTVGVGVIWFNDLRQCLDHTGIPCAIVQRGDAHFQEKWEEFRPNVFISMDLPEVLKSLDFDYINQYKKKHGCLRLFTPGAKHHFPKSGLSTEDQWRLELACSGQSVDAYFSMMAPEFFSQHLAEWEQAGFKYLTLPNACNPIDHYPLPENKDLDYFMATSHGIERVEITWQYLKPIFKRYYGLWAGGSRWGFGIDFIPSEQMPSFYARTRIAPNPLMPYLIQYPMEICDRTFSAAACGIFQITNWTPVTDRFFTTDELTQVRTPVEFLQTFEYYIKRPEERNTIALKTLQRVFSQHTYFHRIDMLVSFLDTCQQLF